MRVPWGDVPHCGVCTLKMDEGTAYEETGELSAVHGLSDCMVSDNGPSFTERAFTKFLTRNGIRHIRVAPYHPASNGLAKRAVKTFKSNLRKQTSGTLDAKIAQFLLHYSVKPHTTTGLLPSELFIGRKLKTSLDLIHPGVGGLRAAAATATEATP